MGALLFPIERAPPPSREEDEAGDGAGIPNACFFLDRSIDADADAGAHLNMFPTKLQALALTWGEGDWSNFSSRRKIPSAWPMAS